MNEKKLDLIADRQHHRSLGTDLNTTIQVISVRNTRNFVQAAKQSSKISITRNPHLRPRTMREMTYTLRKVKNKKIELLNFENSRLRVLTAAYELKPITANVDFQNFQIFPVKSIVRIMIPIKKSLLLLLSSYHLTIKITPICHNFANG